MTVLVTGGAGYIGSVTVERLIASGESVVVFDNLSQGHRDAVHPEANFVQGDLANRHEIDAVLAEHHPDVVMHFASRTLVGESMQQPFLYLGENIRCGLNLLEAAVHHNVRSFILSSTANLFDDPQTIPIEEDERIQPGSPYGESKAILERMLYWLDRTEKLRFTALRYFNAAGATADRGEDHDPETHLIPLVLQVALGQREQITVFGGDWPTSDGSCVRDYVHIADLADAHILAMHATRKGRSATYNLGNGTGYSVYEVIQMAEQVTGQAIAKTIGPRRPGDVATLVAGSRRIREELGWAPRYSSLEAIMTSAWNWHRGHPRGYDA